MCLLTLAAPCRRLQVSAFAAAAGRGASAFVEAFRHAVGSYRSEHRSGSGRRSNGGGSS